MILRTRVSSVGKLSYANLLLVFVHDDAVAVFHYIKLW